MSSPAPMRAVLQSAYGGAEVLRVGDAPVPDVPADGVRIRVAAASLNRGDWHLMTGAPYIMRLALGLTPAKRPIPGMAAAGTIDAVGAAVRDFAPGDRVVAQLPSGAFAPFAVAKAASLARIPDAVSFEDAATLPIAATTARGGLRDAGRIQAGQSILINGASGGVGHFTVQIAKLLGATVTAVCSGGNAEAIRALGADHLIDHHTADFTKGDARYDFIFDIVGNHPLADCRRVLTPKGAFLACAGGAEHTWVGPMGTLAWGMTSNLWSAQRFAPVMDATAATNLTTLLGWVAEGRLRPWISARIGLDAVPAALGAMGAGRTRGKIVVDL
jgi:NADPH:quinone reductase-like Zn-dependent oxidoreductase